MSRTATAYVFLLFSMCCHTGHSMACQEIDLGTAWQRALAHSPDLAIVEAEIAIKQSETLQASLPPNPFASVEAEDVLGTGPYKNWESAQTTYSISQDIELGGKRNARASFATSQVGVAFWQAEVARQDLRYELVTRFINVFIAQEKRKLASERESIAAKTLEIVEAQVAAGKVSPIQKRRSTITLKTAHMAVIEASSQLQQAKNMLAALWGSTAPDFQCVAFDLFTYTPPPGLCELAPGITTTPDHVKSQQEVSTAVTNLQLQYSNRIPDITLRAGYRTYGSTSDHAYVLEAQIPIPLFNQNQGNIQKAHNEMYQASCKQKATQRNLMERLTAAYEQWSAAFQKAEIFQETVLAEAEITFELTQQGYQKGKLQHLDLLDTQRTLFEVQEQFLDVLHTYHQKKAEIERVSGTYNFTGRRANG